MLAACSSSRFAIRLRAPRTYSMPASTSGDTSSSRPLNLPAGKRILLTLINSDPLSEEFDSPTLKAEKVIAGSSQGIVRVALPKPGTYEFVGEHHEETAKGRVIAE
jgi:Cupredoxin-like domain